VAFAGVKENPLGSGGLTRINVGHNADISHGMKHSSILMKRTDNINAAD
jgi:hypothetical protein